MQRYFNNITAEGVTYRKGINEAVPENLLWIGNDGRKYFWCSVLGGTSGSSSSPRTEYRETMADDSSSHNWHPSANRYNAMIGTCSVNKVPGSGKVIFAQIHAHQAKAPFLKLLLSRGQIRAEVRAHPDDKGSPVVLSFPYQLGEDVEFAINVSSLSVLTVGMNETRYEVPVHPDWLLYPFYFKAGSYVIDNAGTPDEGGLVAYSHLEVYHGSGADAGPEFKAAAKKYLS